MDTDNVQLVIRIRRTLNTLPYSERFTRSSEFGQIDAAKEE